MAPVNPAIPNTQDPNYLGLSKPITQPQADQSNAALFKGIGDVGSMAIKVVDETVKSDIDDKVYKGATGERDAFTANLEQMNNLTPEQSGLTDTGIEVSGQKRDGQPMNLMQEKEKLPMPVQNVGNYAQALESALGAGRITPTYYHARLSALASSIRAQYPGYREYIDKEISSVTGVNPANAYVSNLIGDLNKDKKEDTEVKEMETLFKRADVISIDGIDMVRRKYVSGEWSKDQAYSYISRNLNFKYRGEVREDQRKQASEGRADIAISAKKGIDELSSETAANMLENTQAIAGMTGTEASKKIFDGLAKGQTPDPLVARQMGEAYIGMATLFESKMRAQVNKYKNGSSIALEAGGAEEADKIISVHAKRMKDIGTFLVNKEYGPAFSAANYNIAMVDAATNTMLTDVPTGKKFAMLSAAEKLWPKGVEYLMRNYIEKGFTGNVDKFLENQEHLKLTQPDEGVGKIHSVNDSVVKAKNLKIKDEAVFADLVSTTDKYIRKDITDQGKVNLAKSMFSVENRGMLSEFKHDTVKDGNQVWGRNTVWNNWTKDEVIKETNRLAATVDPAIKTSAANWYKESFALDLFRGDLNKLRGFRKEVGDKLSWDDDGKRWEFKPAPGTDTKTPYYRDMAASLGRINHGLDGLKRVANGFGFPVEPFLLEAMETGGLKIQDRNSDTSMSGDMLRSLVNQKFQAAGKAVQGAAKDLVNSPINY